MLLAGASRSSGESAGPFSTRLDDAPEITARGVRRSCEIDASRSWRRLSTSARRTRVVRSEITSATTSMIAKVTTYCMSATAKVSRGGTKKKSNAATERIEAATPGPRPKRSATTTTARR
jgi:hypothetical protein